MAKKDYKFEVSVVTFIRNRLPSDARYKMKMIKEDSKKFREIVKKTLEQNGIVYNEPPSDPEEKS